MNINMEYIVTIMTVIGLSKQDIDRAIDTTFESREEFSEVIENAFEDEWGEFSIIYDYLPDVPQRIKRLSPAQKKEAIIKHYLNMYDIPESEQEPFLDFVSTAEVSEVAEVCAEYMKSHNYKHKEVDW